MAWSTNQLASLTGVTLRSIRHWHDVGLLPEPGRLSNNYKQYQVEHLVLALRIKRLSDLGFSLDQIATMLDTDPSDQSLLLGLRDELTSNIERLERARDDVDRMIKHGTSPDLSVEATKAIGLFGNDKQGRQTAIVFSSLFPAIESEAISAALAESNIDTDMLNQAFLELNETSTMEELNRVVELECQTVLSFMENHPHLAGANATDQDKAQAVMDAVLTGLNKTQTIAMREIVRRLSPS